MTSYAQQRSASRSFTGIGIVVLLHVIVAYFVLQAFGLHIDKHKAETETKILDEIKPPPPDITPPPPPPPTVVPPPVFIPPPEIIINTPPPPQVVTAPTTVVPTVTAPIQHVEPAPVVSVPDTSAGAKAIAGPPLQFPPRMLSSGREGSVDVACDIDVDGSTSNCEVLSSNGGSSFVDAALEYVKHAKYKPATHNGQPVKEAHHRLAITFKLNG